MTTPVKRRGRNVELTPIEREAQQNLKSLWAELAPRLSITQRGLAAKYECNPSNVSQIINGFIPLNLLWLNRLSRELDVPPEKIMPNYRHYFNIGASSESVPNAVTKAGHYRKDLKFMPDISREVLNYSLPHQGCLAIEVLLDTDNRHGIRYGTHIVFVPDEAPSPEDTLAVAQSRAAPENYRIIEKTKAGWVDVFDGFALSTQTYKIHKRVGIIYTT